MKILITGGFGYLGGRLAQHLSAIGHEIVLGSRKKTGTPAWLPGAKSIQTTWNDEMDYEACCSGMDVIIHGAGMNAQDCLKQPQDALLFNGVCTARLLQAAIRKKVGRFIYLSTAHVYASPLTGVITEDTRPTSLHPYATSHRAGEDAVLFAHQSGGITGLVVRISNAYGAPVHDKVNAWMLVVNDLCRQAATMQSMTLNSSGSHVRDFVPILDVARAIGHLLNIFPVNKNIFNIGGQWPVSILEIARLIQDRCKTVLGFNPSLTHLPTEAHELPSFLDYKVDALKETGFRLSDDKTGEIDSLLKFCRALA